MDLHEPTTEMCCSSCLEQLCNRHQSTSSLCCEQNANMHAARQTVHAATLMHGCTPVSASQFNHGYNDSNDNPHVSSFTSQQSHPAPPPEATPRQSHGFVFDKGQLHPPLHRNGQGYTQSGRSSPKEQMSGNRYSHLLAPETNLAGSLLCSSWPPLPLLDPEPHSTAIEIPNASATPRHTQTQPCQLVEPDSAFSFLEQIFSMGNASLNAPTPGLTPNSSLGSTPAASSSSVLDDNPMKTRLRGAQQGLEGCRRIQPKPPELPSTESDTHAVPNAAGLRILPPGSGPKAVYSHEELPEWPETANLDFEADESLQLQQFQIADFDVSGSGHNGLDILDLSPFETLNDEMPAAFPDLPPDFDPFPSLSPDDDAFAVGQSLSTDPSMPSIPVGRDTMAVAAFDNVPYTGAFGVDCALSLVGPFPQTAPTLARALHGEGSRRDTTRDDELVRLRANGLSYRDIKLYHRFDVAESTLRGRMRSLMKSKEERVRKPTWKPENIRLLCHCVMDFAVHHHLPSDVISNEGIPVLKSEQATNKVSWKKVAQAMADQGSYHYGNATVKKKYMDLRKAQMTGRL